MNEPNQYNENYYLNRKSQGETEFQELRVVPKQSVREFTRIFDIYNKDKSGLMTITDIRSLLKNAYGRDDLVEAFLKKKNLIKQSTSVSPQLDKGDVKRDINDA